MTENVKRGPGRPKGSRNKPKLEVVAGSAAPTSAPTKLKGSGTTATPGVGHNKPPVLTDEQRKAHFLMTLAEYERLLEAKDKAVAAIRVTLKKAKVEGVSKKDLDEALRLKAMEADAIAAEARRRAEIAQWTGVGVQLDLLDFTDRRPAEEKAEAHGFEVGARGDSPDTTSYTGAVEQAFLRGFHRGVAARGEAIAKVTNEELAREDAFIDRTHAARVAHPIPEPEPEPDVPSPVPLNPPGEAEDAFRDAVARETARIEDEWADACP